VLIPPRFLLSSFFVFAPVQSKQEHLPKRIKSGKNYGKRQEKKLLPLTFTHYTKQKIQLRKRVEVIFHLKKINIKIYCGDLRRKCGNFR
jgi:hypothetical protein